MPSKERDLREKSGLTQLQVAVYSGTSPPSVRLYEADRMAISPKIRAKLDAYYKELEESHEEQ